MDVDSDQPANIPLDVEEDGEDTTEHMDVEPDDPKDDQSVAEEDVASDVEDDEVSDDVPVKRGRGRGRGRGSAPGRPRGGPRGRPRGRGRGRGTRGRRNRISEGGILTIDGAGGAQDEGPDESGFGSFQIVRRVFRKIANVSYALEGDELVTQDDPKGDQKIDALGNLLGGREFKAYTFNSPFRSNDQRKYMLSIDAARTSGFRDSLYFFRRNPLLVKLTLTQGEKDFLIAAGKLSNNLKSRSVTMVTARSAFKCQGSKLIKDGKWVDDDYYEEKAREECVAAGLKPGEPVGELPDPNSVFDPLHPPRKTVQAYDRAAALHKPGGLTTTYAGPGLSPFAGEMGQSKRIMLLRAGVDEKNWMHITAKDVWETNDELKRMRKERLQAFGKGWEDGCWGAGGVVTVLPAEEAAAGSPGLRASTPAVRQPSHGRSPLPGTPGGPVRATPDPTKKRVMFEEDEADLPRPTKRLRTDLPLGIYDGHTDLPMFPVHTQPSMARMERMEDSRIVIGGASKIGSAAWALAYVDFVMELPKAGEDEAPESMIDPALS